MVVYKISCKNYYYFGQASNYKSRWSGHRSSFRTNNKPNPILKNLWDKYGEESFSFEVLYDNLDKEFCNLLEEELIEKHYSDKYCCNIAKDANIPPSRKGKTQPEHAVKAVSNIIICNGIKYKSQRHLADHLGVNESTIYRWLKGLRRMPHNLKINLEEN